MNKKNNRRYLVFSLLLSVVLMITSFGTAFALPEAPEGGTAGIESTAGGGDGVQGTGNNASDEEGVQNSGNTVQDGNAGTDKVQAEDLDVDAKDGSSKAGTKNLLGAPAAGSNEESGEYSDQDIDLSGTGKDDEDYIKSSVVYRRGPTELNWTEVTDDNPVRSDDDVRFALLFQLPPKTLIDGDGKSINKAHYDIRMSGNASVNPHTEEMKDANGRVIGTYEVTQVERTEGSDVCGKVEVTFTDDYIADNVGRHAGDRGSRTSGEIDFTSSASTWTGTGETERIHISNSSEDVSLIIVDPTAKGDIKITKQAAGNFGTGELTYTMTIVSKSGTSGDVTINDTMSGGELIKGDGNFKVKKNGSEVTPEPPVIAADGKSFVMTLGSMAENDEYVITYDAYYPLIINGSVAVKNYAVASSTHNEDGVDKHLVSSANCPSTLRNTPISKTGGKIEETTDGLSISWTVTVNPNGANIKGWWLKDEGKYGNTNQHLLAQADSVKMMRYEKGSEAGVDITSELNIPTDGIPLDGDHKIYTFGGYPESGDDTNTCKYVLTYRTKVDFEHLTVPAHSANNIAILETDKLTFKTPPVTADGLGSGLKTGDYVDVIKETEVIEGKEVTVWYAVIGWTVNVEAKYSPVAEETLFSDKLGNGQEYRDPAKLVAAAKKAFQDQGVQIEFIEGKDPSVEGNPKDEYQLKISKSDDGTSNRLAKGKTVKFSYESKFRLGEEEALKKQYDFSNGVVLDLPDVDRTGKASKQYKPLLKKYGVLLKGEKTSSGGKGLAADTRHSGSNNKYVGDGKPALTWEMDVNLPHNYFNAEDTGEQTTVPDAAILRDELPLGTSPTALTLKVGNSRYTFANIASATKDDPSVITIGSGDESRTAVAWYEQPSGEKGGVVTVRLGKDAFRLLGENTYTFRISADVDEDFQWEYSDRHIKTHEFENVAVLAEEKNKETSDILSDTETQKLTNDEHANAVIKKCNYNTSQDYRIVPYSVVVNEEEKDLVKGSDTIEFEDSMQATYPEEGISVTLVAGSVKIYEYDPVTKQKTKDITDEIGYEHIAGERSGDKWIIKCDLPDEKAIVVEYEYYMSGFTKGREQVKLRNTSSLSGIATISPNGEDAEDIQVLSRGGGEIERVIFHKVDENNTNIALDGAVFDAYIFDKEAGDYKYLATLPPSHVDYNEEGRRIHGEVIFNEGNLGGHKLKRNTAYRLIEKTPPAGYRLDTTPVDFMIVDRDHEKYPPCAPKDFSGYRVGFHDAGIYIKNHAHTPLKITKTDKNGRALSGAVFDLYMAAVDGEETIPFTSVKGNLVSEDLKTDLKGEILLPNWMDPGDYYLVEKEAPFGGYVAWDEAMHFRFDGERTYSFDNKSYISQKEPEGYTDAYEVTIKDFVPELALDKEASVKNVSVGDMITYTITVENKGEVNVHDVLIGDKPEKGLQYISDNAGGVMENGEITWTKDIRKGETLKILVTAKVTGEARRNVVNRAYIKQGGKDYVTPLRAESEVRLRDPANTGDSTQIALWIAVLMTAAAGCAVLLIRRRQKQ